jgi:hypothetical protein
MAERKPAFERIKATLTKTAAALKRAEVDFALAGGVACWARGGPAFAHDVDYMVRPEHAERALAALADAGLETERPPEEWLYKAWDDDILVDLIFQPMGLVVDDALLERCDVLDVLGISIPVMQVEDVLTAKLLAMHEHYLDYEPLIDIVRSLREQIDWAELRERTNASPYARAFFVIAAGLGLSDERPEEPVHPGGMAPKRRRTSGSG